MFIGDGAKMVRDAFALAKEKQPAIIFIDEIDAIGTKRFDSELSGDREVQRTMLELLNQLDGFTSNDNVKVSRITQQGMRGLLGCCSWAKCFSVLRGSTSSCNPCLHGGGHAKAAVSCSQLHQGQQLERCELLAVTARVKTC